MATWKERTMHVAWRFVATVPALVFVLAGLLWLTTPGLVSAQLGMPLLSGVGLSTQIGDFASFFLTLGGCALMGVATGNSVWFLPSIMLLVVAALGRIIAWMVHDAALVLPMILVELAGAILFSLVAAVARSNR